ncbi:MAG: Ig-like domain-containing protein, partial [Candidatus Magasanikbacteria bacterium]|nr:Ig-like domain-containing protein [Candidatus Magasanikbacteria bacterium]
MVPDSISQSANIILTLPDGVAKDSAKSQVTFTPEIKGEWLAEGRDNQLVYRPNKKLTLGHYYSVTLEHATGQIGKDFLVVEDPSVIAVFPKADSETHEKSNITVLFNRPMVPVTTLDTLAEGQVPVSIEPKTEGKYKWIGTRTLQFIPNDSLKLSSKYTVKVASDIPSLDGIRVKGAEVNFSTRHLRKTFVTQGTTVYSDPVVVKFNQAVDLDRTVKEISVVNVTNNNTASEVVVEYGKNKVYNEKTNSYDTVVDESQLFIFNKRDQHGRAKLWDTTKQYTVTVAKAFPKEGDIIISESLSTSIQVTDVIANISATSPRSQLVRPDLFDPKGKIVVDFFEEIDLTGSSIAADKVAKIEYGEVCKEIVVGEEPDLANCEKITNKKSLVFTFDDSQIKKGEKLNIQFKHLVNKDRVEINSGTITQIITAIPELVVRDSKPSLRASGVNATLTYLTLCTNVPLFNPAKKDISNYIKVYPEYEYTAWSSSYYVSPGNQWQGDPCQVGDFETNINYGLMPETQYYVDLSLVDQFDSRAMVKLNFKTGKMDNAALLLFHYQKGYNVTTPSKTELTYAAQNMEYVDVTICQLSAESMLNELQNYRDYRDPASAIPNCLSSVTRKIQLPKRYWIKNFFTVNLKDFFPNTIGHYIVTLSHPNYLESSSEQVYERSYVTVTNLSLVEKKVQIQEYPEMPENEKITANDISKLQNLYWVTNMSTLDPVPGAALTFYSSEYDRASQKTINKKVGTASTDSDGIAKALTVNMLAGAIVTSGNDSAILTNNSQLQYSASARRADRYYVYTDRPIYRPGDEISVKGITRVGYDGNYEILRDKPVNVIVYDSVNTMVTSTALSVSDFGTFNKTFSIDSGAPLGTYRIEVDGRGYGFFDVEEYVSAAFKLEAKSDKSEYIAGDTAAISIDADYYFGVPVEGGSVEYSIASQDYYFDKYRDEYFQFGSGWYSCYYDCRYGDQFILRNTVPLSQNGKATIKQPLDYKTLFANEADRKSKIFVMYVTVKDKTGKAVSTQQSFIVHGGEYYLGLNADSSFLQKNQAANIKLKSVDTEGKPKSAGGIVLSLRKIKYTQNQRQEVDGSYYYNWEKKFDVVSENKVSTDSN